MTKMGFVGTLLAASMGTQAAPVSVDLTGWTANGGSSNWNVQAGNDAVLQTVNGAPTIFFDPSATSTQGKALSGTIQVLDTGDDDFIGFVLGYDANEVFSSTADYYLIDWKQGNQSGWNAGLRISHVTDGSSGNNSGTTGSFWQHTAGQVDLIDSAINLGSTGWVDGQEYLFDLVFTSTIIQVYVDGALEIDVTASDFGLTTFDDGSFGFYNYSQPNVLYAGIEEKTAGEVNPDLAVSAPGALALLLAGLVAVGASRRR